MYDNSMTNSLIAPCRCTGRRHNEKGNANLVLHYHPITAWAQRGFACETFAKLARHRDEVEAGPPSDAIRDIYDGQAYKKLLERDPRFREDSRHMVLAMYTDGVLVHKDNVAFSVWPLLLVNMNLPPDIRYRYGVSHLAGFVAGKRSAKAKYTVQPLIQLAVDEINYMDVHGVRVHDAHQKDDFTLHAKLLLASSDYRGLQKTLERPGAPAKKGACYGCLQEGHILPSTHKTVYSGSHRFLPLRHWLRRLCSKLNLIPGEEVEEGACGPTKAPTNGFHPVAQHVPDGLCTHLPFACMPCNAYILPAYPNKLGQQHCMHCNRPLIKCWRLLAVFV